MLIKLKSPFKKICDFGLCINKTDLTLALALNFGTGHKLCPAELSNLNIIPSKARQAFLEKYWLDLVVNLLKLLLLIGDSTLK